MGSVLGLPDVKTTVRDLHAEHRLRQVAFALTGLLVLSLLVAFLPGGGVGPAAASPLPRAAVAGENPLPVSGGTTGPVSAPLVPSVTSLNPPHLSTAIRNSPSLIYTYKNQQELTPQDSQVSLFVNATGNGVPNYANVQVVFVVETTLYDGVYDPTVADSGVNNPCNGPCQESNSVPYFVANAGKLAGDISANNPYSSVSFAMVDYFATLGSHDDGDGAEYHVDVGNFVTASSFQTAVVNGFQNPVLGGSWYYGDSDFSDNIGDSSSITALYGALKGSNLAWNAADHHVIVWIGSTTPRDSGYPFNYAGTHSDYNSGYSATCEPSYNYGAGIVSPSCEQWISGTNNLASLAQSLGVTIDTIDVANGMTDATSQDYTTAAYGSANSGAILKAGCDLATATGGSWEGPSGYGCSVASTGTGQGNLTCTLGSSCYQGQSGTTYSNPPRMWSTNTALGWAIDHISFGPVSVTNTTASSNGVPMFQFVPQLNITPDPTNPAWTVTCLRHGSPVSGCQQTPTVTSQGTATVYGWAWPLSTMNLNDTWKATFNVVATGAPYNVSYPLDACTGMGCQGPVGGAGALSIVDYKNYQGTATTLSFPASDIYVVYPGMSIFLSPPFSRGYAPLTQTFSVTVGGGQAPFTYQWYIGTVAQTGATSPTFTTTFSTTGVYVVRCLVWDAFGKQASGTSQVTLLAASSNLFNIQGNVTDSTTLRSIPGATVALNGTWGTTTTNSGGSYTLGPVMNGTYTLFVNASGYSSYAGPVVVHGTTWDNVALKAVPPSTYTISGYVTDYSTGAPLSGAVVNLTYYGSAVGTTTSNAQGQYSLTGVLNATYALSATLAGFNPASLTVTVQGANVVQNISLSTLPPKAYYITGTVTDATTHAAIKGAVVTLNATLLSNTTNTNGVYLLSPVYAGIYTVACSASGYSTQTTAVTISTVALTVTFALNVPPPPPTPTYYIQGTVLDASTQLPVSGANVVVSVTGGSIVATAHASNSGDYAVTGLVNGTYDAVVGAPGYHNTSLGFTIAGTSQAQNFFLTPLGGGKVTYFAVQGLVLNASNGAAVSGVSITVSPLVGTAVSGSTGTFLFPRVQDGNYSLMATAPGYAALNETFQVSGSNVQLTLNLTPSGAIGTLYSVSGLVEDATSLTGIPIITVEVLNVTNPPVTSMVYSAQGGFTFRSPNAHLELRASAQGYYDGYLNMTVKGAAVSGVMIYLAPVIPSGGNNVPPPTNFGSSSWTKPGPYGLYLQLWVPPTGALATFGLGWLYLRRRHAPQLGRQQGGRHGTPPEGSSAPSPPPASPGEMGAGGTPPS